MSDERAQASNIIPFPLQLRPMPHSVRVLEPCPLDDRMLVDHDGRSYPIEVLLRSMTPEELQLVDASLPRTAQEIWDEVIRRWPVLADVIAAGVPQVI